MFRPSRRGQSSPINIGSPFFPREYVVSQICTDMAGNKSWDNYHPALPPPPPYTSVAPSISVVSSLCVNLFSRVGTMPVTGVPTRVTTFLGAFGASKSNVYRHDSNKFSIESDWVE